MVHEKPIKNEEKVVLLNQNTDTGTATARERLRGGLIGPPLAYPRGSGTCIPRRSACWKFGAHTLIACLFFQNIFTLSTPTLTYPASQHISRAIYLHKLPIFSVGENISAPHHIKLSSSNSCWSLSSVKQHGDSPDQVR